MAEHVAGKAPRTTHRRNADQRRAYALRRLSLAVDRALVANPVTLPDLGFPTNCAFAQSCALASKWAKAWHAHL